MINEFVLISVYLFIVYFTFDRISSKLEMDKKKKRIASAFIWFVAFFLYSLVAGDDGASTWSELFFLCISALVAFSSARWVSAKAKPFYEPTIKSELPEAKDEGLSKTILMAVSATVFFIPFLFVFNVLMQVVAPIVKDTDNSVIEHLGTFGDFFGGMLSPILTFVTFIALIATILIQLKELRMTRQEMVNAANAQEETAKSLQKQEQQQKVQQFDNTFFNLLDKVSNEQDKIVAEAKAVVTSIRSGKIKSTSADVLCEEVFVASEASAQLNRFNSLLFQVLKFVDNHKSEANGVAKKEYTDIVRAVIDNDVMTLLFLNSSSLNTSVANSSDYETLVSEAAFFENLDLMPLHGGRAKVGDLKATMAEFVATYGDDSFGQSVKLDEYKAFLGVEAEVSEADQADDAGEAEAA
ncbi:MAG: hypothetical protein CMI12_04105 [Oceanospirillum sp.]|nr:hypothetical protein [Oceanospirillum sp.]